MNIKINNHAQARALERFGVFLNNEDLKKIKNMIIDGEAEFIKFVGIHKKGKVSAWKIQWNNIWLYPLMLFEKKVILTFVTKGMIK